MKLNNKGYMLIEIILASVLAFGIAYFLLNLTYKFKNENETVYKSIDYTNSKNLITKNIMDDIGRGNTSGATYNSTNKTLDFKIKLSTNVIENRRLAIKENPSTKTITIEYGKTRAYNGTGDIFFKDDISYYKRDLPKNERIKTIDFHDDETTDFTIFKIEIDSLYDDNTYDIKLLLSKKGIIDETVGNCNQIVLEKTTTILYFNSDDKKFYSNSSCSGTQVTSITPPTSTEKVTMPFTITYNNGDTTKESNEGYYLFNSYKYNDRVLINSSGQITTDESILNSIISDITLNVTWDTTNYYPNLLSNNVENNTCKGWYRESTLNNKVGSCGKKAQVTFNAATTLYVSMTGAYSISNSSETFTELANALSAVNENGTISLTNNVVQNSNVTIAKRVKIKIGSYKLTNKKTITISTTGSIYGDDNVLIENRGTITINSGTLLSSTSKLINNFGSLTINNGAFIGCKKILISNGLSSNRTGKVAITGGTFMTRSTSCETEALLKNSSKERDGNGYSVKISGGVFWHGGNGDGINAFALENDDETSSGFGIFVNGTAPRAYSAKSYVVFNNSGKIQLDGGKYYSSIKKFTKSLNGNIIKTANYEEIINKLAKPPINT